jgi:ankyrin repeat protein
MDTTLQPPSASPLSPRVVDHATIAALTALMRLIATDVTDPDIINDALAAVLGADVDSDHPAGMNASDSNDHTRAPEEAASSPFDTIVALPPDTPALTDADDGGNVPTVSSSAGAATQGLTPLEFGVLKQNVTIVKHLLKAGAHVDFIGGFSCTALCKCCYNFHKNIEMIKLLLAAGANPDATTNNDTASASCLIISVVKDNVPAVQALLEFGADVSYEWKGSNALAMALDFKKLDIAQLFENFEYRKAQHNRWQRYQDRRRRADEERVAKMDALRDRSPTPSHAHGGSTNHPAAGGTDSPAAAPQLAPTAVADPVSSSGRTTPTRPPAAVANDGGNGGGGGSPRSVRETAQLTESLSSMDWLVPLDDIEWGAAISAGAHGQVYRGTLKSTGDPIAIKKFPCHDARSREGFRREVEMLIKFRHENIVLFRGAVITPECSALLTELCTESLFDRLERLAPIPWAVRLRWARDVAKGMTYLHARTPPVVHRDLKSLNVLLDINGTVKLCDFGIARLREHTFVMTQHIAGSPSWMAPEVLRGDDFGPASDVYSFGVLLWELMTRQVPWPNKNMAQLVGLVGFAGSTLAVPDRPPEGCPARYLDLMRLCFAPAPQRPTFKELRQELDRLIVDVD